MEKTSDAEQTLEHKVEEQKQVKEIKYKIGLTPGAVIVGAGAVATYGVVKGVKSVWNLVYPPKFKKIVSIGATVLLLYGVTHPKRAVEKIGDWYDAGSKAVKTYIFHDKENKSLKEKVEELSQGKATLQENFEKKENDYSEKLKTKDKSITRYEKKTNELGIENKILKRENDSLLEIINKNKTPDNSGVVKQYDSRIPANSESGLENISESSYAMLKDSEKLIFVDKPRNKLIFFEKDNEKYSISAIYNCSTGINPGSKRAEGDKATPEGWAYLNDEINNAERNPLFGTGGYKLNFKNQEWTGILICGTDMKERVQAIDSGDNRTNGSVVLKNKDMLDLKSRIGSNYKGVKVIIGDYKSVFSK